MKAGRPAYPDHYRTLRVTPTATQEEIRRAYRLLAKRYHPDRVPPERREWAREQMARINAAYEVLGDPQRRAEYDLQVGWLQHGLSVERGGGMAAWHLRRTRERARRNRLERRLAVATVGAAALSSVLVTLLITAWIFAFLPPDSGSWLQRLVHRLGMDTTVGMWVWGIVLVGVWAMAWIAYKLTEL